jgi:hypothetical protein
MMLRRLLLSLFIIGLLLLVINISGLFINLRNNDIFQEKFTDNFGIKLSEKQFYSELEKIFSSDQSDSFKAISTSLLVNKSLAHYWRDEGISKYNLTIPVYENYILFSLAKINPGSYQKHEYLNWKKAIERGVGLCSQHAIIVSEILNERGIKSKLIGLSGHVIATSEIRENKWILLDPDYGVNIPFNIGEIESDTEIIEPYYKSEGYSSEKIETLKRIFGKEGNYVSENAAKYSGNRGKIENRSYLFIWFLPIILISPYIFLLLFIKGSSGKIKS